MNANELNPQLIIVMGGAGSGKNHFIENNPIYSKYQLIDVDAVKAKLGVSAAISSIKPMLQAAFEKKENVAHPTTGGNLKAQENKIALAHQYGYTVTLILIATDPHVAVGQVRDRVEKGGHDVQLDAIVTSNKKARENFDVLSSQADDAKVISNSVTEDATPTQQITFKIGAPNKFSPAELNEIAKIIQSESQVAPAGLVDRIRKSKLIAVALDQNKIVGISAIKVPNESYHQSVFDNAGVPEQAQSYPFEMGWKVVLPEYRGQNLGSVLSTKLLNVVNKSQVFATVRSTNAAALAPLKQLGFTTLGKPFRGSSGNQILLLSAS